MAFSNNIFAQATDHKLFGEYIGAQFLNVKFSDVPINSGVNFHFMLAFAIDYTTSPSPTNGNFNVYWDTGNLSAAAVRDIKSLHSNVKVALSVGGDTVRGQSVYFKPDSVDSWVDNAVSSLTRIIKEYDLDGIDINYEHFSADADTFAECVGRLIKKLKDNGAISFVSIAPFGSIDVQNHYQALWKKYASVIDFVNFQFYADNIGTVSDFVKYFDQEISNYEGGKILASFVTDQSRGFTPDDGFFTACTQLKKDGKLGGIFVWSADTSKGNDFKYEKQAQAFLLE